MVYCGVYLFDPLCTISTPAGIDPLPGVPESLESLALAAAASSSFCLRSMIWYSWHMDMWQVCARWCSGGACQWEVNAFRRWWSKSAWCFLYVTMEYFFGQITVNNQKTLLTITNHYRPLLTFNFYEPIVTTINQWPSRPWSPPG